MVLLATSRTAGVRHPAIAPVSPWQKLAGESGLETVQDALRAGARLVICHAKEDIQLTHENPLALRPVSRWGGSLSPDP